MGDFATFLHLESNLFKVGYRSCPKKLLSVHEFRGKQYSESLPLLADITECPYFPHLLCTVDEIHYKIVMLFSLLMSFMNIAMGKTVLFLWA